MRKKVENRHSFLPDCIRSAMSSCRWWDTWIVGETYPPRCSTLAIPRLKHDTPYQGRDHSQDWQVRCCIGREAWRDVAAVEGVVLLRKNGPPLSSNDAYPSSILRGNREHLLYRFTQSHGCFRSHLPTLLFPPFTIRTRSL